MATVEQRGPGSWRVGVRTSVEAGRKWIRRTLTFPPHMPLEEQRARAELAAAQLQLEVTQGKVVEPVAVTVRDIASYDERITAHAAWVDSWKDRYDLKDREGVSKALRREIGKAFAEILECAGVYKRTEAGRAAFRRFYENL